MKNIMANDGEIVAVCDQDPAKRGEAIKALGGNAPEGVYKRFDEFIRHPGLQAAVLASDDRDHAACAIRCLKQNIHVLTECISNLTMAEGVALVRAAGQSKAIFMLAENYSYLPFSQEMRRVCRSGSLGRVLFAEGESDHPGREYSPLSSDSIPSACHVSHALAPLMFMTGSVPKRVTAFPVSESQQDGCSSVISILNTDASVFRVIASSLLGAAVPSYRLCGEKGQIENIRGGGGRVLLSYNRWQIPEGKKEISCYMPACPGVRRALIEKSVHNGGDYFTAHEFLRCIREGQHPEFDEYFATAIASVGILARRSQMAGGVPFDVPDFHLEKDRLTYENDHELPRPYPGSR